MNKKAEKSFSDYIMHIFIGLGLVVFYLDSLTPPGYTEWILYSVLLYVYTKFANKNSILIIALIYSCLLIAGYFSYLPASVPVSVPIVNRSLGIIILIVITYMSVSKKRTEN